jgi:ribonuclease VapC
MRVFVDSSALVAILAREDDALPLSEKLDDFEAALTSPIVVFESALALVRIKKSAFPEAQRDIAEFLAEASIAVVAITEKESDLAVDAHARFGKGRHRAALNMGDCFSYACARVHRVPLLCKGDDFIHTDIRIA